ncbi:unnamed protein product [Didymodactylos carnosus]|uniref:Uncharacterized protein n=1 Tax=Didymodactylos carnosus TaxID=1234261 RepID=A0A813ZD74_9BILA|nr:unnamed protein product [Didymodactylos carnosus]CAF3679826.1 unnamed protein product [Didymodactylos carnosus]
MNVNCWATVLNEGFVSSVIATADKREQDKIDYERPLLSSGNKSSTNVNNISSLLNEIDLLRPHGSSHNYEQMSYKNVDQVEDRRHEQRVAIIKQMQTDNDSRH